MLKEKKHAYNLMIFMKMLDSAVLYHLLPISKSNLSNSLYLIRENIGPTINKVVYYPVPDFLRKNSGTSAISAQI